VWAAERIDEHGAARLRAALAVEAAAAASGDVDAYNDAVLRFHQAVAALSGNEVCALFVQVLTELNASLAAAPAYRAEEVADTARAHSAIAEAIIAGDPALAGHRAISHMRASHEFASRLQRDA
jgi:DNA-binding FadR family transcriptional regulator